MPEMHELPQAKADWHHDLVHENDQMRAALLECREYFDERADADQPSGSQPIPNEEMRLLMEIDGVLGPSDCEGKDDAQG
jgi:hypothetical protein